MSSRGKDSGPILRPDVAAELIQAAKAGGLQLDLQDQYAEVLPRSITALHRFFKIYVKGFPGAAELRNQLMNTKSTDEVRALLDSFEIKLD